MPRLTNNASIHTAETAPEATQMICQPAFAQSICQARIVAPYARHMEGTDESWPALMLDHARSVVVMGDAEGNSGGHFALLDQHGHSIGHAGFVPCSGTFIHPAFRRALIGRIITGIEAYEVPVSGIGHMVEQWPALRLDNGLLVLAQRDGEGNGPGFLALVDRTGTTIGCAG